MRRLNLEFFRRRHNLTQAKMADRLKVSRATYCQIEQGKRNCSLMFLKKLQAAFNIPDDEMWSLAKQEESEE